MRLLMESGKDAASTLLLLLEMRDIRAFYVRIWAEIFLLPFWIRRRIVAYMTL
jgi:hypothetical protein